MMNEKFDFKLIRLLHRLGFEKKKFDHLYMHAKSS